ncbi:MAG: hypothetical protein U5R31_06835 [Acidimicrobiia bacterium]|nr:hypothetical protein [Acidimicrobiia bacterium]
MTSCRTPSPSSRRSRGWSRASRTGPPASSSCWHADETSFVLVASPKRDTVEEAGYFAERLSDAELSVRALVINRMFPRFGDSSPDAARERARTFEGTALGGLYANLADFLLVASEEEQHLAGLAERVPEAAVVRVPYLRSDVHDIDGMGEIARHLFPAS